MEAVYVYGKETICALRETTLEQKKEQIKEAVFKAFKTYPRHSTFRVAVSKRGLEPFHCVAFPASADTPQWMNPAAFDFMFTWKSHWKVAPDTILQQIAARSL